MKRIVAWGWLVGQYSDDSPVCFTLGASFHVPGTAHEITLSAQAICAASGHVDAQRGGGSSTIHPLVVDSDAARPHSRPRHSPPINTW